MSTERILILAPHADDAEFGLGVFIQTVDFDVPLRVCIAATGDYSRSDGQRVSASVRRQEARTALSSLYVEEVAFMEWFHENKGRSCDYADLVGSIESEIRAFKATQVFVCLPSFNQDHRVLFDATITAFRPGAQKASLYAYEYPGNAWGEIPPIYGRRYRMATEGQIKKKQAAIECHISQWEGRTAGVSPQAATTLAAQRGAEIGVPYAELTYVLKEIA